MSAASALVHLVGGRLAHDEKQLDAKRLQHQRQRQWAKVAAMTEQLGTIPVLHAALVV